MNKATLLRQFAAVCGDDNIIAGDAADKKYLRDFLNTCEGRALAIVKPRDTAQVSAIVKLCAQHKTPIVPQGGNTSYCAGATPPSDGRAIVLSTENMKAMLNTNTAGGYLQASAGCALEAAQMNAAEAGWYFPLNIGAKSACHLGGNLSTNAGGLNFLRYGGARELCLGLEAALPSGEIINLMSGLRKNNSGYDIKNLIIGSEGTLAIITAAVFKLFPPMRHRASAFVALPDAQMLPALLALCQKTCAHYLESFEMMPRLLFELLSKHYPQILQPFATPPPLAVLLEMAGEQDLDEQLPQLLAEAMERQIITDAVLATSERQRRQFWMLRELSPEATRREGQWAKLDIALPLQQLAPFIAKAQAALADDKAGMHIIAFGHAADGNLHVSLRPQGKDPQDNMPAAEEYKARLLQLANDMGGTFSAEHGIGRAKNQWLHQYKDAPTLRAMRTIKNAIDPHHLMNPGVMWEK